MIYTVNVNQTGFYKAKVRVASESGGGSFHFEVNGEQSGSSINVDPTGSYQNWTTVTVNNIYLEQGDVKLKFRAESSGFNLGSFEFEFVNVTGLEEDLADPIIYPNPARSQITISYPVEIRAYRLINSEGRLVKSGYFEYKSANEHLLDISGFNQAFYILELLSGNKVLRSKIVIQ